MKINPEITQEFVAEARRKAKTGSYQVRVAFADTEIPIIVFPEVFPPKSAHSASSRAVYESFGNLCCKEVADIGSGTGILAIVAALCGADHVDATEVNETAVACTRYNVLTNGMEDKVSVYQGSLFEPLPEGKRYDLVIANLPIVNFSPKNESGITKALYDPDFALRRSMLIAARSHLNSKGIVMFTFANLQSGKTGSPEDDFDALEKLLWECGYLILKTDEYADLGYSWRNYQIVLRSSCVCVKDTDGSPVFLF